jgi:hypothetical protein
MSYTVTVVSENISRSITNTMVTGVKITPVTFNRKSIAGQTYNIYPMTVTTRVAAAGQEVVDFRPQLPQEDHVLAALAVKSTRPVEVTVSGVFANIPKVFQLPATTYYQQLFDSSEFAQGFEIHTVTISNAAAATTSPTPLPPAYPAAEVELFAAVYEQT